MRGRQAILLAVAISLFGVFAISLVLCQVCVSPASSQLDLDLTLSQQGRQLLYEGKGETVAPCAETAPFEFEDGGLTFSAVLLASDTYWLEPPQSVTIELHRVTGCIDQLVGQSAQSGTGYVSASWPELPAGRYYIRLVRYALTSTVTVAQPTLCWISNSG